MKNIIMILIVIGGIAVPIVYFLISASDQIPQVSPSPTVTMKGSSVSSQPQNNNEGAVEVTVTPKLSGEVWEFEISMNTHSSELSEDMVKSSVLIVGGNEYKPILWEGDPPGGHHREGILKFRSISPYPDDITLVIKNISGISQRIFKWNLN